MLCFRTLLLVYRCFLCMASIKFSKVYLPLMFTTLCNKKLIWKWSDIDADFSISYKLHCVKSVQIRSNFWSIFSRIRTEYGEILRTEYREILRISPYSVWMRENTDQKLLSIWKVFAQWLWVQSKINLTSVKQRSASIFRALWAKRN